VPTILIAGIGLQAFIKAIGSWRVVPATLRPRALWLGAAAVALAAALNLYAYFVLERRNVSAMRVMGVEHRLIAEAVDRTDAPVYLLVPGVFRKLPDIPQPGEHYSDVNRNFPYGLFGAGFSDLGVLYYSGRYDWRLDLAENFRNFHIFKITEEELGTRLPLPAAIVLHPDDAHILPLLRAQYPDASLKEEAVRDTRGNEALKLVIISLKPN
jgi:hypothetical protein